MRAGASIAKEIVRCNELFAIERENGLEPLAEALLAHPERANEAKTDHRLTKQGLRRVGKARAASATKRSRRPR